MFHFTIRDVLWLTVVVALGCGWLAERRNERSELSLVNAKAKDLEWKIEACAELFADIGFKLEIGANAVHVNGSFPDGSVSKGINRWEMSGPSN